MLVELRPDKKLLDTKFNGYKLSLDPIPVYHKSITEGVDHITQSEDQYSFIHAKVFSLHNHLYCDTWQDNVVFFVDKTWKVLKAAVTPETCRIAELEEVWTIPNLNQRQAGHFNCSISFPSKDKVLVADGCGRLHLLNRPDNQQWQPELSYELDNGCVIVSARQDADSSIHCVLITLKTLTGEDIPSATNKPKPASVNTVLHWITFSIDGGVWKESCLRRLEGTGSVDYVALETSCSALYVASNARFKFTLDTLNPLPPQEENMSLDEEKVRYTWEQTEDDVKIVIQVDRETTKEDVKVKVNEGHVTISCQQQTVVSGPLSHSVDSVLTTWTLQQQRLEVVLIKQNPGEMWAELVPGDNSGEQLIDPALVEHVHSRLSHLCSDTEVQETGESYAPTFNLDQLEECDSAPEESSSLLRLDTTSHSISHQISLTGHQWLMPIEQSSDSPPCLCVRHDVDGCVWQLEPPSSSDNWPCKHISTFCALGYVAASKQQKKFILGDPDLSYAVICEASNHVFVYYKSCAVSGELRNRKTSSVVSTMAKQQLINLHSTSPVLGACATNTNLFVLTTDTLYLYHIQ